MSDTIQYIAEVYCVSEFVEEDAIEDILISIEEYLKESNVNTFNILLSGRDIIVNVDKKELYRSKLMGHTCFTKLFESHDTMIAKLLPSGHTEETVTNYLFWEIVES